MVHTGATVRIGSSPLDRAALAALAACALICAAGIYARHVIDTTETRINEIAGGWDD